MTIEYKKPSEFSAATLDALRLKILGTTKTASEINTILGGTFPSGLIANGASKINSKSLSLNYYNNGTTEHPVIDVNNCRGTSASPAYLQSGDEVGAIAFREGKSGLTAGGSGIAVFAAENWSATNLGATMYFFTTKNGTTTKFNWLTVQNDGKCSFVDDVEVNGLLQVNDSILVDGTNAMYLSESGENLGSWLRFRNHLYAQKFGIAFNWPSEAGSLTFYNYAFGGSHLILRSSGASEFKGDVKATSFSVGATNGASGSFTTNDGKTVTVTGGIITSIV